MDDPEIDAEHHYSSSDSEVDQRQAHQASGARPANDYDDKEENDYKTIEDVELDFFACMLCNLRSDASNDDETVALDATLTVTAPGHISCDTLDLGLTDDTLNILNPITLLAGDVDNNDTVDITDGSIIVSARVGAPTPPVPEREVPSAISELTPITLHAL